MCGADDCPSCHPENFINGEYYDKGEDKTEPSQQYAADRKVIDNMRSYGGCFVKALGEAAMRADPDNLQRIRETWPEYWFKYSCTMGTTTDSPNNQPPN